MSWKLLSTGLLACVMSELVMAQPGAAPVAPVSPAAPAAPAPNAAPAAPATPAAEGKLYISRPFDRLELSGTANVRLIQGERDQVFVAGDAEAQKQIELDYSGDRLQIRSVDGWKMWRSQRPQIDVTLRRLHQLVLSGAGDLHAPGAFRCGQLSITISGAGSARFDDLTADKLNFGISGAGTGRISGQAHELTLRVSGKGRLQAENLQVLRAGISISGIGDAEVWATEQLAISVSGFGQVDYWGRPELQRQSSGISRINARGDKPLPGSGTGSSGNNSNSGGGGSSDKRAPFDAQASPSQ